MAGRVSQPRAVEAGVVAAIRARVALAEVQILHRHWGKEQALGKR